MKDPKVLGSDVWQREVMIWGEICVLSLIYSYIAVCRFCV